MSGFGVTRWRGRRPDRFRRAPEASAETAGQNACRSCDTEERAGRWRANERTSSRSSPGSRPSIQCAAVPAVGRLPGQVGADPMFGGGGGHRVQLMLEGAQTAGHPFLLYGGLVAEFLAACSSRSLVCAWPHRPRCRPAPWRRRPRAAAASCTVLHLRGLVLGDVCRRCLVGRDRLDDGRGSSCRTARLLGSPPGTGSCVPFWRSAARWSFLGRRVAVLAAARCGGRLLPAVPCAPCGRLLQFALVARGQLQVSSACIPA